MRNIISAFVLVAFLASLFVETDARGLAQKRQNAAADRHDLTRIKNLDQLKTFIHNGWLVPIGNTAAYAIADELGEKDKDHRPFYKHARPWTKAFLDNLLGEAHRKFGTRYNVTSLVRTAEYQRRLCKSNSNAICGTSGWKRSSHMTGATVDISYVGLSRKELRWFHGKLSALQAARKIIYVRETDQACYHIMVLPSYAASGKANAAKRDKAKKPRKKKKR